MTQKTKSSIFKYWLYLLCIPLHVHDTCIFLITLFQFPWNILYPFLSLGLYVGPLWANGPQSGGCSWEQILCVILLTSMTSMISYMLIFPKYIFSLDRKPLTSIRNIFLNVSQIPQTQHAPKWVHHLPHSPLLFQLYFFSRKAHKSLFLTCKTPNLPSRNWG